MGTVIKPEIKFADIPEDVQRAALEVIVYRLTLGGEYRGAAQEAVEETKKAFLKLYE